MTNNDMNYIQALISKNILRGPVLELGGGYGGDTSRELITAAGMEYVATDIALSTGVDVSANFETGEGLQNVQSMGPFKTVLVLNVLEHVFNPIEVLRNVLKVTDSQGRLVVIAPAIWPVHNYPIDCNRLLPDWYRQFATQNELFIDESTFEYLGYGSITSHRDSTGQDHLPVAGELNSFYRFWSRAIHKLFNTFGRGMLHPSHVCIGVAMSKLP